MKFILALVSTAVVSASAVTEISEVKAESKFGQNILSKARRLDGDAEEDQTWIADMSLKFQGCHHISQWNPYADGADDVRIESRRLAKFRLCPTDTCNSKNARGCSKGYGDYIVDMDDFLASYLQNKEEVQESACDNYLQYSCNCGDADDADSCAQSCYKSAGMDECIEDQYYGNQFEVNNYLECAQYQPNENGRRLDGNAYYEQDEEYYIGSYCAAQGGSVVLGMFTDDACTNFADSNGGRTTFYGLEGTSLPYSDTSIVDTGCWSCEDEDAQGGNYGYDYAEPKQVCTDVYDVAGKCETNLYSSGNSNLNTNACSYMSGIQTVTTNGVINTGAGSGNKVANGFIGVFAVSFILLGSYTYYLKTKLDRGKINLSD